MAVDLDLARKRWKLGESSTEKQRSRVREDLGFYEGELQWDTDIRDMRKGRQSDGSSPAVPARPCLTINQIKDPIRRVLNDFLQADLAPSVVPADDFEGTIDNSEIELREGLIRRIQRQSYAQDARMWAASRAAIGGEGFYGLLTKFVKASFDQEIIYRRFYNQFSVMLDPAHEEPDGSDAEWAFVGHDVSWDTYREEHSRLANGKKNPAADGKLSDDEWRALGDDAPNWFTTEGENRSVRISEYWWIERVRGELVLMDDGSTVPAALLPKELVASMPDERKRMDVIKQVKFAKIDGLHVLEETDWPGQYIPIIKVVGEEIQPFDKERRCEGMVRAARDPQKAYNAMISAAVEMIAMSPKSPLFVPHGQLEGFEDMWKDAAVRNWPYLPYNLVVDTAAGPQPAPPPQRNNQEPPIQAMAAMVGVFDSTIKTTIGAATLNDTHPEVRSGKMAKTIIDEAIRGTSNYMDNLVRSAHYEGQIINDLLYPIYGIREGRIASIMSGNKSERVMIGQPFVPAKEPNGKPQAFDPQQHQGQQPKSYALTKDGSWNIAIKVSKYFETKRQQQAEQLGELISAAPEAMLPVVGDLFFENQDGPGHAEMAKRFKAMLAPQVVAMLTEGQPPDPRLAQAMEMGKQLAQEVQQLRADKGARIESAQIKAVADAAQTDKDNQTKLQVAEIQAGAQITIADLKSTVQQIIATQSARDEQLRTLIDLISEDRKERKQREHDARLQAVTQGHEVGHTAMQHEHAKELAALEHEHAKALLSHEASVMPPTPPNGAGE